MRNNTFQRRSSSAQLKAMARDWPHFRGRKLPDGTLIWDGHLRPKAHLYIISIIWKPKEMSLPYVTIHNPKLKPRLGGTFSEIPHLIFYPEQPEFSGLCLFDPKGHEWTPKDLIAETTILWTAEWLVYYELWHLTGNWLAPSIGYESVAHIHAAEALTVKELITNVY